MSASTHLAQFNLTLQQAHDFVNANLGDLQLIFGIARQYGITTDMLGEIVGGYSGDQVSAYLTAHGLPGAELNPTPLFTDQLAALGGIISQDPYTGGILSVAALRERVVATTGAAAYDRAFNPDRYEGAADGVFTAAELGAASSLGTLAATSETMQSLFYGTVVRALTAIDFDESLQLSQFATQHLFDLQRGDGATLSQFATLLVSVFEDAAAHPVMADADIAEAAVGAGVALVQAVGQGQDGSLFQGFVGSFLL